VEVEDKLRSLDCIAQSAVIGTPDPKRPGSDIVNLHVELTDAAKQRDPEVVRQEIVDFCRANMAAFKVPKQIVLLDSIPLTAVGKIDKKALRA
jgi:long-chain acyl-CoA synthetase